MKGIIQSEPERQRVRDYLNAQILALQADAGNCLNSGKNSGQAFTSIAAFMAVSRELLGEVPSVCQEALFT